MRTDVPDLAKRTAADAVSGAPAKVEVLHIASPFALWACAIAYVAAVLVAAYAAYRWIEVPGRAYFGRLAKRIGKRESLRPAPTILTPLPEPTS